LRLLGYYSENTFGAAALAAGTDPAPADSARHGFEWHSQSVGAEWTHRAGDLTWQARGWRASGDAAARWHRQDGIAVGLAAARDDLGALALVERKVVDTATRVGAWVRQSRTVYEATPDDSGAAALSLQTRTPVGALFLQHERPLAARLWANLRLAAATTGGRLYFDHQSQIRWRPAPALAISGTVIRSHQFAQSLRNPESLAGNVFPPELFIGTSAAGVPVPSSNQGVVALEYRPFAGTKLGAQFHARDFHHLLLVSPRTGEPFAAGNVTTGSGRSRGVALEAAVSHTRYGFVASYGWQRLRLSHGDSSYVPTYGVSHAVEAGVIVFPSPTFSLRLGATATDGRRATESSGAFEWESCNLLDRGCEFAGSPLHSPDRIGGTPLPPYVRLDLGIRKHWHLALGGRDAVAAVFGTVTNVLGRRNVLTTAKDPSTGERVAVEMRPFAPLVIGLDWRF
jgi:hypothetical protein